MSDRRLAPRPAAACSDLRGLASARAFLYAAWRMRSAALWPPPRERSAQADLALPSSVPGTDRAGHRQPPPPSPARLSMARRRPRILAGDVSKRLMAPYRSARRSCWAEGQKPAVGGDRGAPLWTASLPAAVQ